MKHAETSFLEGINSQFRKILKGGTLAVTIKIWQDCQKKGLEIGIMIPMPSFGRRCKPPLERIGRKIISKGGGAPAELSPSDGTLIPDSDNPNGYYYKIDNPDETCSEIPQVLSLLR